MTKILRISPTYAAGRHAWQVEVDDTCVCVRPSRSEAIDFAHRIVDSFADAGVPCEAVLSASARPVRIAA